MFSKSEKYKVLLKGRTGLTYIEDKKSMTIDSELFFDPAGITIYTDSINSWDTPFDRESLTEDDRKRIIENITNHLENSGYKVDVA